MLVVARPRNTTSSSKSLVGYAGVITRAAPTAVLPRAESILRPGPDGYPTAANELTMTEWDPVSKQPLFKYAAVRLEKVTDGTGPSPAPTTAASRPADSGGVPATVGGGDAEADESISPITLPAVAPG